MLDARDAVLERSEGTDIDWKAGKNVSSPSDEGAIGSPMQSNWQSGGGARGSGDAGCVVRPLPTRGAGDACASHAAERRATPSAIQSEHSSF